jgi:hypothetical protein
VSIDQLKRAIDLLLVYTGPCLLVYSVISFFRTSSFLGRSTEVNGEVIRLEHSEGGMGTGSYDQSYTPVFSFTAADGESYTVTSGVSSSSADFMVGESVRVRYDPANPQNARIHTFLQTWGTVVISGVVGAGFVAFGCWQLGLLQFTWPA